MGTINKFYTYIYLDPRKRGHYCYRDVCFLYEPVYVGKGQDTRYLMHLKYDDKNHNNNYFKNKLSKILAEFSKQEMQNYILIFRESLTEQEALELEKELILKIGRATLRLGPLTNLTEGGDGLSGFEHSEGTKQKISEKMSGENNPRFGIEHSNATKQQISETLIKTHPHYSSENNPNFVGQKRSAETCHNLSLSKQGVNHPNYGKHLPKETRQHISEAKKGIRTSTGMTGHLHDESTKQRISAKLSGQKRGAHSAETRAKIKEAWARRKQQALESGEPLCSEETRKKISENQNRSEESKKRRSKSHIGKKLSDETCRKMSETRKGRKVKSS